MTVALLEPPVRLWSCPSCSTVDRTQKSEPHTQMHHCGGFNGLAAPLVEVQHIDDRPDARHKLLMRDDYCGDAAISPLMAIHTDHGDGSNDRTVFAPTAPLHLVAMVGVEAPHSEGFGHGRNLAMRSVAEAIEAEMAWSTSNGNAYYVYAMGTNAVKPSTDAFKVALFGNSVVPAQSATQALTEYAGASATWSTGNEASGTGYTAGGVAISSPGWAQNYNSQGANVVAFSSAGTPQWTTATFTAYGCLPYDTTASNQAISWNYFGGAQQVTAGTFSISWAANGIMTLTC